MVRRYGFRWVARSVFALVAMLTVIAVGGASAAGGCKKVSGTFTLQPLTGPACASPVGICATGSFKGGLKGHSTFVGSSLITTADTPTTSVVLLTGDNQIETGSGTLMTKDAIVLQTTGAGTFAEVDTIVGGTDAWAGATGQISAVGTFNATSGGSGSYSGEVCR